ncbi:MAG: TatD family hydrolase [Planctomycetota bacterium]
MHQLDDLHCHVHDPRLRPHLPVIRQRCHDALLRRVVSCSTGPDDWQALAELAADWPQLIPAFGLHPWYTVTVVEDWLEQLRSLLLAHPRALIGEAGLDGSAEQDPLDLQRVALRDQLRLAQELNRPVVVHVVRAWSELIVDLEQLTPPAGVLIHASTADAALIEHLLPLGAWFSYGGAITNPERRRARASLQACPADRLLLETDCPDNLPANAPAALRDSHGDMLNDPSQIQQVLQVAAALRGEDPAALAARCRDNADRFLEAW